MIAREHDFRRYVSRHRQADNPNRPILSADADQEVHLLACLLVVQRAVRRKEESDLRNDHGASNSSNLGDLDAALVAIREVAFGQKAVRTVVHVGTEPFQANWYRYVRAPASMVQRILDGLIPSNGIEDVRSPSLYLTALPGPLRNDKTIPAATD